MTPEPVTAQQALIKARQAMQRGDHQAARRWAEETVALDPGLEEPWLILASLAGPRARIAYLDRALQINPKSEVTRNSMHQAVERLREKQGQTFLQKEQRSGKSGKGFAPGELGAGHAKPTPASLEPDTQPVVYKKNPGIISQSPPLTRPQLTKSQARIRWSFITLFIVLLCAASLWIFWPSTVSNALSFLNEASSTPVIPGAPVSLVKPTYTSTFTPTFTPTATFTPTPTATDTPTPTATFTPTATLPPTNTPRPSSTSRPWPTNTPYVYVENNGVRWIDVDLSQQMLYAYEGNVIVASFLVSTGVPAYPTVTGQFHIYVKYVSILMTGPGYYLPNVPYTMYFYKGYGLHGTYWHHNFGHPMSHGCVNMYTPDAEWLFYWASVGTLVNVHY